ncbi:uncharacterized protein BJ171DRAFT_71053 [Polychytrium aggregatum]|uniref:uncharacterized protein n=1 Tax=Polychytrium aggregatum TaxID=110093 RepID=UPI0022FDCFAB|nr:uncharacterized protein BJ171DRAFT_71053 [Polychytrium aggregatum]KAI9205281.1 hypothetical protein BJ171DRAFT_71053 [Polychytrium aggregatum]
MNDMHSAQSETRAWFLSWLLGAPLYSSSALHLPNAHPPNAHLPNAHLPAMAVSVGPSTFLSTPFLVGAVSILIYFSVLGAALLLCLLPVLSAPSSARSSSVWIYLTSGLATFGITWFYILRWIGSDLQAYWIQDPVQGFTNWVVHSDLFDAAYVAVVNSSAGWWWSCQHLLYTLTVIVFFWAEGPHRLDPAAGPKANTNTWIFVVLGFLGAMGFSVPLFLAQHHIYARGSLPVLVQPQPSMLLSICIGLSLLSVVSTTYTPLDSPLFGFNLKLLHGLLFLPIVIAGGLGIFAPRRSDHSDRSPPETARHRSHDSASQGYLSNLYWLIAGAAITSHAMLTLDHFSTRKLDALGLWAAIWTNDCQTSISVDYLASLVVITFFMAREIVRQLSQTSQASKPKQQQGLFLTTVAVGLLWSGLAALALVASLSVVFPIFLAVREGWKLSAAQRHKTE